MAKYRIKPIEATQFKVDDISTQANVNFGIPKKEGDLTPHSLDGKFWLSIDGREIEIQDGDYVIKNSDGSVFFIYKDIFESKYELVE